MDYEKEYGLTLSPLEKSRLKEMEESAAICAKCQGLPCRKRTYRELMPCAKVCLGRVYFDSDECRYKQEARRQRALAEKVSQSGIPAIYRRKSYSDYVEISENNSAARLAAQEYLETESDHWLYIWGGCGTGKTFLASLIAKEWIEHVGDAQFTTFQNILEELKSSFDDKQIKASGIMGQYLNCDLLVLDDVGTGYFSDWGVAIFYWLINERYNAVKPTVLTSNYSMEELRERLVSKDAYSGARIISRLRQMCQILYMGEYDFRAFW